MVNDKHECIFVHLRRTGGNSIELALGGIVLLDENGEKHMLGIINCTGAVIFPTSSIIAGIICMIRQWP